jgi:hypothetical protein
VRGRRNVSHTKGSRGIVEGDPHDVSRINGIVLPKQKFG